LSEKGFLIVIDYGIEDSLRFVPDGITLSIGWRVPAPEVSAYRSARATELELPRLH
jgi:hypothetical protein